MTGRKISAQLAVIIQLVTLFNGLLIKGPAQNAKRIPETIYANPANITINTSNNAPPRPASVYPSNIQVSGMTGNTTRVAVTLNGFSHGRTNDVDILLVSPSGAKFIFLADAGGFSAQEDKVYTFADDAASTFPPNIPDLPSGSFRPTSGDSVADTFPAPAPAAPYSSPPATFTSTFNGSSPNGTWSLFVVDDATNEAGSLNAGWSVTITTDGAPMTFSNPTYIFISDAIAAADPYGSTINISGVSGVISNLKVGLTGFTHTRPADVDILLVSPNGMGVVIMSDAGGSTAASNADLTFDDAAPSTINTVTTGTYRPTDVTSGTQDVFPSPAPLRPYVPPTNPLTSFRGFSPNGEWRLFVVDDEGANGGSISGGWVLDITTVPVSQPPLPSCSAPSFARTNFASGNSPTGLALADYNNDTKTDIAVANQVSNNVSIMLGNGDGTFMAQTVFPAGTNPYSLVAGKFNADNNFDLAVVNSATNSVSVLLGTGTGSFGAPTQFLVGPDPISIAAGDLNGDGNQDLAVANFGGFFSGSVSILLGNGMGSFTAGTPVRTRTQPSAVAIANLNAPADTNLDLVVTSFGSNSASTFFGNGNGTFVLSQNLNVGQGPVAVDVADIGIADGFLDFIVANYNSDSITTCNGSANGVFSCGSTQAGGANPISIAIDDYSAGAPKTPAIALSGSNTVRVGSSTVSVGLSPNAIDSSDLNGDGKVDLVSANYGSNDVSVMLNTCAVAAGNIFDWDGDRRTDFNVIRPSTSAWYNASLSGTSLVKIFSRAGDVLAPADYDGDGRTDYGLYRPEFGLWIVHTGQLFVNRPLYFLQFGLAGDIPTPGDFDGDGKADLAVFRPGDGHWYIRRSSDNSVQVVAFGASGDKPVTADFDGDRKSDVAVFRPSTGVWYVLRSSDNQPFIVQFGASEDRTVVGDYDGDGKADNAVWRPSTGVWWILRSSDGGFVATAWGGAGDIPVVGDYENDGKFDLAVWRPSDRIWYVLKSSDGGAIYYQWGLSTDYPIPNAYVR